jgi:ribosomal protein L37AE/L43A
MRTTVLAPDEICPHCRTRGSIRRPSRIWWAALGAAWVYALGSTFVIGNIGPFIMLILPFFLFAIIALVAEVHQRATAEPTCDVCGKIVVPGTELRAGAPAGRHLPHPA